MTAPPPVNAQRARPWFRNPSLWLAVGLVLLVAAATAAIARDLYVSTIVPFVINDR